MTISHRLKVQVPNKSDKLCCGGGKGRRGKTFARRTILADFKCHALYFHSLRMSKRFLELSHFGKCVVKLK